MADGAFRFNQAGPFPHHSQYPHHRNLNRATSPRGNRRPFSNDTPSPTRSPATATMSQNYNMYSQNGYHGSQMLMNGGQNHQRYAGGMQPKYQQQNHNVHHNQIGHQQHHHQNGQYGHQQNQLSGGFTPQSHLANYGHDQQNGHLESLQHDELDYDGGNEWRQQLQLASDIKRGSSPNHNARQIVKDKHASKSHVFGPQSQTNESNQDAEPKRVTATDPEAPCQWAELDMGGMGIRSLDSSLFRYTFLQKLHLAHNKLDHLPEDISKLRALKHLDLSYNELTDLPEEIGMLTNLETLYLFGNQIQTLPGEMGYLFKLKMLGVVGNPLEEEILSRVRDDDTSSLIHFLRENMPDPEPPEEREWYDLEDGTRTNSDTETFKALTYNILADGNVNRTLYGYVSDRVLAWQNRRAVILDEITHADADIVCLQELDREAYDDYFRPNLSRLGGYQSYYAQRGRADTAGDRATKIDGCGTFWKDKKYIVLDKQSIHLGRKAVERPGVKASADMVNRVFMKDHIATIVLLENRMTGTRMIVVNTHVFWDPAYKDVKLIQVAVLLEEVTRLSKLYAEKPPCTNKKLWSFTNADDDTPSEPAQEPGPSLSYEQGSQIPMVICGDFNSGYGSTVWDLMTQRTLPAEHPDFAGYNYNYFTQKGMEHPFVLKSAYGDTREAIKSTLNFTNYVPNFVDVLDYIWYSSNTLRVTGLLGKVDEEYLRKVPGFPNAHFPSDHLALVAEFVIPPRKTLGPAVERPKADFGPSSRN